MSSTDVSVTYTFSLYEPGWLAIVRLGNAECYRTAVHPDLDDAIQDAMAKATPLILRLATPQAEPIDGSC